MLRPAVGTEFSGSALPTGWSSTAFATGGSAVVGSGRLNLDGASAGTTALFGPGHSLEAVATFNAVQFQHLGFGVNYNAGSGDAWAIISTGQNGTGLLARSWNGSGNWQTETSTVISGNYFGSPHRYRIDWKANSIDYYVDGNLVATHNIALSIQMRPLLADSNVGGPALTADWLRLSPYSSSATFTSRVFDSGAGATWETATWNADIPSNSSMTFRVRTGNVATPDSTWSNMTTLTGSGSAIGASSRYIQYQVTLATTDPAQTPALQDVVIRYHLNPTAVTLSSFTARGVVDTVLSDTILWHKPSAMTISRIQSQEQGMVVFAFAGILLVGTGIYTARKRLR